MQVKFFLTQFMFVKVGDNKDVTNHLIKAQLEM